MRTRTDAFVFWAGVGLVVAGNVASWLTPLRWLSLSAVVGGALIACAAAAWRLVTTVRADKSERGFLVPLAGFWAGVVLAGLSLRDLGRGFDIVSLCLMAAGGGAGAFLAWSYMRRT